MKDGETSIANCRSRFQECQRQYHQSLLVRVLEFLISDYYIINMNKERYVSLFEDLFSKSDKVTKQDCRAKFRESFGVFNPYSTIKVTWDLVGMLFIFIQMITIPLIITFSIELDIFYDVCNQIMNYFFLVDIVISFNTGYYCKYALHYIRGSLVTSHAKVIKNYFTTWFFVDLISSFPYDSVIGAFLDSSSNQRNS